MISRRQQKDLSIETLRGIAILLVIAGHVIGSDSKSGLKVEPDSIFGYLYYSTAYIRLPLFTAISGFVYAIKPVDAGKVLRFIKGKARRILLPMIFVGAVEYIFRVILPGVNRPLELHDIWKILIYPFDHFWFLQSIFLVFLCIAVLEVLKLLENKKTWFAVLIVACMNMLHMPQFTDIFSFTGFLYLFPFFVLGYGINRFEIDQNNYLIWLALTLLIIGVTLHQFAWFTDFDINTYKHSYLSLVTGISSLLVIFRFRRPWKPLARLGYFAYGIYLFHVFGTAGSRITLNLSGIDNIFIHFVSGMVSGILVPVVIGFLIEKNRVTRRLFLGLR